VLFLNNRPRFTVLLRKPYSLAIYYLKIKNFVSMLVIRYLRVGKKNQPSFKIVVTDKRKPPRGGRFVEILGFYNPLTKKKNVKKERILHWLSKGAQPSVSIHNLLISEKIIEGKKIATHSVKKGTSSSQASAKGEKEVPKQAASPAEAVASTPLPIAPPVALEKPKEEPKEKKEEEKPVIAPEVKTGNPTENKPA